MTRTNRTELDYVDGARREFKFALKRETPVTRDFKFAIKRELLRDLTPEQAEAMREAMVPGGHASAYRIESMIESIAPLAPAYFPKDSRKIRQSGAWFAS